MAVPGSVVSDHIWVLDNQAGAMFLVFFLVLKLSKKYINERTFSNNIKGYSQRFTRSMVYSEFKAPNRYARIDNG
jgi:hypothetical protein